MRIWTHLICSAATAALLQAPAYAQSETKTEQETQPENDVEEQSPNEIVVTANRRSDKLQDVPIAVSAFTSEQLARANIQDTQGLQAVAPSLVTSVSFSENSGVQVRLRGVGTGGSQLGFEGSVGAFIDGIYRSRPGTAFNDFVDIERIEVLRGPQGTLFGKNTSAGTITLTSAAPTFETTGNLRLSYGNRNAVIVSGALSGPISGDKVAARLSFSYNRADGFIHDPITGKDHNDRNRFLVRGQLLFNPSERTSLRLIGDYSKKDEDCCVPVVTVIGSTAPTIRALGGVVATFDQGGYANSVNTPTVSKAIDYGFTADFRHQFDWADWKVLAGYRRFEGDQIQDGEWSYADIARQEDHTTNTFYSFETTLNGAFKSLDWLVGAYYFNDSTRQDQPTLFGTQTGTYFSALSGGLAAASRYPAGGGETLKLTTQEGRGWSVFTHNILRLAPGLRLTAGLRYQRESKDGTMFFNTDGVSITAGPLPARCVAPTPAAFRALCPQNNGASRYEDSHLSGTAGIAYDVASDLMIFANYANGFKGGGISAARDAYGAVPATPPVIPVVRPAATFLPETVDSFELGFKSQWFDKKLTLNVTAFRADYTNFQIQTRDVVTNTSFVSNAASVFQRGVEAEASVRPVRGLTITGSATYARVRYGDDTFDATLRGQQLGNAPYWIVQGGINYDTPLGSDWRMSVGGNVRYTSSLNANTTLNANLVQPSYTVASARLSFNNPGKGWTISYFMRNVGNTFYASIKTPQPNQAGGFAAFPGEPRSYGIELRKSF
jgi:iron complex outermembrane recepter protein